MGLLRTLKYITAHPLNEQHKFAAVVRFVKWQISSRLKSKPLVYPITNKANIYIQRGLYGVTGNLYCGLYEYNDMAFLLHFLRKGDVFADVGANVGSYTILAAAHCEATTFSFEPGPVAYGHLEKNVALNQIGGHTNIYNIAVSSEKGNMNFTRSLDTMNHIASADDTDIITVPVDTLDNVLKDNVPALLKIDVEGFETEVIKGATGILANEHLKAIIIELIGSGRPYGYDDRDVHDQLLKLGFGAYTYLPKERELQKVEKFGAHNTLYIRDIAFVTERLRTAQPVKLPNNIV